MAVTFDLIENAQYIRVRFQPGPDLNVEWRDLATSGFVNGKHLAYIILGQKTARLVLNLI